MTSSALVRPNADLLNDQDKRQAVACYRRYGRALWKEQWLRYFNFSPEVRALRAWERNVKYEPSRADHAFWERSEDSMRAQLLVHAGKSIEPVLRYLDALTEAATDQKVGKVPSEDNIRAQSMQRVSAAASNLLDRVAPSRSSMPSLTVAAAAGGTVQLMVVSPAAITERGHIPIDVE